MVVKRVTDERFLEAIRLSEYAFRYKVPKDEIEERYKTLKKHQLFGIIDNDNLAAKLHLIPLTTYIGNQTYKMGGIAGVATYPEYRRKGYVKEMLIHVLENMKSQGMNVSMLHPFDVSFYRKFGWELYSNRLKTIQQGSDLLMLEPVEGEVKRYLFENVDLEELQQLYIQYATKFSGMLVRDHEWWKNVIDDLTIAVYYDSSKKPLGYLLYEIKENKMVVEELVALSFEARQGLWNFICQHDSMITEVEISSYEREPLFFALKKQKTVKREVSTYFMVRIVDVESFLQDYKFVSNESLKLQITDPYAEWNEKTFVIENGSVSISEESDESLILSINALSTALFGHQRPTELYEAGMITGNEANVLRFEQMIPNQPGFMYDFF
ncbi:GNAT family N-acetyltransferase [Ferdinandcohnia sp. Marseille-Q9671]